MTNEQLRMQMLAGVITEGEYTAIINKEIEEADRASLNESMIGGIVGVGAINQIPPLAKTDYEMAFEHFLGERYEVKPNRERDDIKDIKEEEKLDEVLQNDDLVYERMLDMDQEQLVSSILSFAESNPSTTLVDYLNNEFGYEPELEEVAMNEEDLQNSDVKSAIDGKKLDLKKLEDATKKAMSGDSTDLTMFLAGVFEGKEDVEEGKEVEEPTNY